MIKKTVLYKGVRKIHKWSGLILGLQLLAWIAGGLVMSALPMDWVHGDHLVNQQNHTIMAQEQYSYPLTELLADVNGAVESIHYSGILNQAVYKVTTSEQVFWFNANNGQRLNKLSQQQINDLAKSYYIGDGELVNSDFLSKGPLEIRGRQNLWQVHFEDLVDTTIYMSPYDGKLIRVRSDIWRFYDFFWMLHIMDYSERSDSHHWLLIAASGFGLLFSISGVVLLFQVFRKRDFTLTKRTLRSQLKN